MINYNLSKFTIRALNEIYGYSKPSIYHPTPNKANNPPLEYAHKLEDSWPVVKYKIAIIATTISAPKKTTNADVVALILI